MFLILLVVLSFSVFQFLLFLGVAKWQANGPRRRGAALGEAIVN